MGLPTVTTCLVKTAYTSRAGGVSPQSGIPNKGLIAHVTNRGTSGLSVVFCRLVPFNAEP